MKGVWNAAWSQREAGIDVDALTFYILDSASESVKVTDVVFTPSVDELNKRGTNE